MPKFDRNRPRRNFNKHRSTSFPKRQFNQTSNKEYQCKNQLLETEVGITQFLSKLEGFSGVIKARFSDFQLNEIDLDGKIAKLTDQLIPKDFNKKQPPTENLKEQSDTPIPEFIPQEKWDSIKTMLTSTEQSKVEVDVTESSREDREKIHICLKKSFGKKIVSNTMQIQEKKVMMLQKHTGKSVLDNRFKWPADKGEYVHFIVYKECLDTLQACMKISDCLGMSASNFNYAGVKDKRAKTSQWFSVRKVEPWKLIIKTKSLRNNVKIGNITFKDAPLKLGQLKGNKFRIALRNVTASDELIQQAVEHLKTEGFINYYGLQRFGNDKETPTYAIGIQLLLGNWKQACEIILKSTKSDDPYFDVSKAKKIYTETKDAAKALKEFDGSRNKCVEYLLLSGLKKENSNEYVNALSSIPRNGRLLYIHAFQSLVWNCAVSQRIEKFGLEVVKGDLVLVEDEKPEPAEETPEDDDDEEEIKDVKSKVKALSAEDCGNYSIYDIVLPLPGYDIVYPENLKDFYREVLEKHGLTLEMTKQKVETYSLSGTYRKILGKVEDLSWKTMLYNDPNHNLIRSDLEELRKEEEPKSIPDGKYKALVLEFSLSSSSYATMVLRELLKTDTSSSSHAKLNNYAEGEEKKEETPKQEPEEFNDKIGLLNDKDKYDAFKSIVFNEENTLKREHDQVCDETAKKPKLDE